MIGTATETAAFWDTFSPYMDYLENVIGINLDNLGPIIPLIKSPVLENSTQFKASEPHNSMTMNLLPEVRRCSTHVV